MARGPNTIDPRRGPDTSDPKRGPNKPDPHRPADPTAFQDPAVQTTKVNGFTVNAGYYDHSYDPSGNSISRWVPFTKAQLQVEADKAASQASSKNGGYTPAPTGRGKAPAPAEPNPKSPGASSPLNLGSTAAPTNAFDNFASGRAGVDYSQSQLTTQYPSTAGDFPGFDHGIHREAAGPTQTESLENLLRDFVNSGKNNIAKTQQQLIDAGFGTNNSIRVTGVADVNTIEAYRGILQNTLTLQSTGQQITPDDFLSAYAKVGKSKAQTTNTYSLANAVQARGAITTAFSDKLGRKPTDNEVAAFTKALNTYEQANPRSDTTVTDPSGNLKSASETDKGTGSVNFLNDFATNYAQTDPSVAGRVPRRSGTGLLQRGPLDPRGRRDQHWKRGLSRSATLAAGGGSSRSGPPPAAWPMWGRGSAFLGWNSWLLHASGAAPVKTTSSAMSRSLRRVFRLICDSV